MIKITVYAGVSETDERPASTVVHKLTSTRNVEGILSGIGHEYRSADYFLQRPVIITLEPIPDDKDAVRAKETLREVKALLEDHEG